MRIKAVDFLTKESVDLSKLPVIVLDGEDTLLRELSFEYYGRATTLYPDSLEKREFSDARNLAGEWLEGSLMGARLIKAYCSGKMKHPESLNQIVKNLDTDDRLAIISTEEWSGVQQTKFLDHVVYVDCSEPKGAKEKQKLVNVRSNYHGLTLDEECSKAVAERCEKVVDIEMTVATLKLLLNTSSHITLKDVNTITDEPQKFKDTTRSVLRGNTFRLTLDLLDGDPLPSIVTLNNVLLRLYTWLNIPEGDESEAAAERMKIKKSHIKEWNQARKKFSPQLIRQVMGEVNNVYQAFIKGNQSDWRERLRLTISRLNQR